MTPGLDMERVVTREASDVWLFLLDHAPHRDMRQQRTSPS